MIKRFLNTIVLKPPRGSPGRQPGRPPRRGGGGYISVADATSQPAAPRATSQLAAPSNPHGPIKCEFDFECRSSSCLQLRLQLRPRAGFGPAGGPFLMLSRSRPAKILSGRPICGPEALLPNIGCDLDPAAVGPHPSGNERPGEWERTPGGSGNEGPGNSGSEGPGAPPVSTRTPAPKYTVYNKFAAHK